MCPSLDRKLTTLENCRQAILQRIVKPFSVPSKRIRLFDDEPDPQYSSGRSNPDDRLRRRPVSAERNIV
jgi:hypothetical protein